MGTARGVWGVKQWLDSSSLHPFDFDRNLFNLLVNQVIITQLIQLTMSHYELHLQLQSVNKPQDYNTVRW